MNPAEFAARVSELLTPTLLSAGGRVLYSGPESIAGRSPIYYLGINPREALKSENLDRHSTRSIGRDLELFAQGHAENAFLDERWHGLPAGTHELQARVRHLANWCGLTEEKAFRRMPASNVVFMRSVEQPPDAQFRIWATACWPVHALILKITAAKILLVGGTKAGKVVARLLGADPERPAITNRAHTANYSMYAYRLDGLSLVVLPPLPRWKGMETVDAISAQDILGAARSWVNDL